MFKLGDLVKIYPHSDTYCFPNSPALNMKGTIGRITKIMQDKYYPQFTDYNFEIVELHAVKPELVDGDEGRMNWRESHLVLVEEENINEEDVLDVITRV